MSDFYGKYGGHRSALALQFTPEKKTSYYPTYRNILMYCSSRPEATVSVGAQHGKGKVSYSFREQQMLVILVNKKKVIEKGRGRSKSLKTQVVGQFQDNLSWIEAMFTLWVVTYSASLGISREMPNPVLALKIKTESTSCNGKV